MEYSTISEGLNASHINFSASYLTTVLYKCKTLSHKVFKFLRKFIFRFNIMQ
jgi:hypothetical protein